MKHKNYFSGLICLVLVFGLFVLPAQAEAAYGLQLETKDGAGNSKTTFAPGDKVYLHIIATELQGVAGCAFTLNYDASVLTAPVTDENGVAASGITSLLPFTFVKAGHPDTGAVTMRENSATSGKILFSGASIDTATGGAKYTSSTPGGSFPLFIVEFTVKAGSAAGAYAFSIVQTTLNNTAAGYAAGGELIPVLIGAVPNTDTTNWDNLASGAFPVLLSALSPSPSATFNIPAIQTYTIGGTITYTGQQTGALKVAAYSDSGLTQQVGSGFSATWAGSSMAYTIPSVPAGTYYVGAFIDSGTPDNIRSATEAQGTYSSSIVVSTSNVTDKSFTLIDPQTNGLPSYWVAQYASYNSGAGIGAAGDDPDHDGYTNLVEYQNGTNPTVADPPGGTGYNPALDTRSYTISGTITYNGTQTGSLKVAAYAPTDTNFATPIGAASPVTWSGTSKTYTLTLLNGTYVVSAFIDSTSNGTRDTSEAQGVSTQVVVSGVNVTENNFTLTDSTVKAQIVSVDPVNPSARAGGSFTMNLNYRTSDNDQTLTGLGLRIYYNSNKLTFNEFSYVLGAPTIEPTPQQDTNNDDGDSSTDRYVMSLWTDMTGNWPNVALPVKIASVKFTAAAGLQDGETSTIRITGTPPMGYTFTANPVTFKVQSFNFDVDGNGYADALSDGIMIIRYIFGFRGTTLINGAYDPAGLRNTATAIEAYLAGGNSIWDVDGNGYGDALSDGIMIIRYIFGFRGTTLINGAYDPAGLRNTATAIEPYLSPFMPQP